MQGDALWSRPPAFIFLKHFIKNLFTVANELLGCEMKNHYTLFGSIKIRMKNDRTAFLDKLKQALTAKMESSDEKPTRK